MAEWDVVGTEPLSKPANDPWSVVQHVPIGSNTNLQAADTAMRFTPQERGLYERHLNNLTGAGGVDNPDGSRSSLYQAVQEHNGKFYNIPTVWAGKREVEKWTDPRTGKVMDVPNAQALKNVDREGWDKFPSYTTPDEADERYGQMHGFMEKDTAEYMQSRQKTSDPWSVVQTTPAAPAPTGLAAAQGASAPVAGHQVGLWEAIKQEPGRILQGMVDTAKKPGEIAASTTPQTTESMIEPAFDLATLFGLKMGKSMAAPAGEPVGRPATPAPAGGAVLDPNSVRFYHGGSNPTSGGGRWVTTDPEYARNFRAGDTPNEVHYVDVPKGHLEEIKARAWDELDERAQTNMVGRYNHVELPEEFAKQMKPAAATTPPVVPPGGQPPPAVTPQAAPGPIGPAALAANPVAKGSHWLEQIFSPETVSPKAGEAVSIVRAATGRAARDEATTQRVFEPYQKAVNTMTPMEHLDLLDYMEGVPRAKPPRPELKAFADDFKNEMAIRQRKLESMPSTDQAKFVEDYVTHAWKDPAAAQQFFGAGKQGSGKFLKERTIGSISQGVRAGLEPVTTNPIDIGLRYVANADRFIALNEMLDTGRQTGNVKYYSPARVPDGWTTLEGRLGRKADMVAAAPDDWARIYNNYISQGAHGKPEFGKAYDTLRRGTNAITSLELGLSGYHALTMTQEAWVTQLAKSIKNLRGGNVGEGIKDLVKLPTTPIAMAMKGTKLRDVYLGRTPGTAQMRQIADLMTEAGGRGTGYKHSPDYEFSGAGSYVTAFRRGKLRAEMQQDFKNVATGGIWGPAKVMAKHLGRVMDTVAQPLFEKYIPALKNGANYTRLQQWLDKNPMATHEEQKAAARAIVDSTDNRFGEMIQDNVFWNKGLKQAAMLAMRSWSWAIGGDIREIGGGLRDTAKAPFTRKWTDKMDYIIALPIIYAMQSMVVQYLMTGEGPENMQDLIGPRTGGLDVRNGQAERLMMPGYMKDVMGFYEHPVDEAKNKIGTAPRMVGETLTNSDWRSDPIFSPKGQDSTLEHVPAWMKDYFNYVTENVGPITLRNIAKGQKKGSEIGPIGSALGVRPASAYVSDPEGYENMMQKIHGSKWKLKLRHQERQKQQYGGPQ